MTFSTVLALVQEFASKKGLPTPNALVGSSNKDAKQFLSLLKTLARDLGRYSWPAQRIRKTWATVAAIDQGTMETVWGVGTRNLLQGTLWHDDEQRAIRGPVSEQEWQVARVSEMTGDITVAWIGGGNFWLYPAPAAGENISAVIASECLFTSSGTPIAAISADTDKFVFPDEVVLVGLEFFWNKEKGESYEWEYRQYMGLIGDNKAKDGGANLQLDVPSYGNRPGIVLPAGYVVS